MFVCVAFFVGNVDAYGLDFGLDLGQTLSFRTMLELFADRD